MLGIHLNGTTDSEVHLRDLHGLDIDPAVVRLGRTIDLHFYTPDDCTTLMIACAAARDMLNARARRERREGANDPDQAG